MQQHTHTHTHTHTPHTGHSQTHIELSHTHTHTHTTLSLSGSTYRTTSKALWTQTKMDEPKVDMYNFESGNFKVELKAAAHFCLIAKEPEIKGRRGGEREEVDGA